MKPAPIMKLAWKETNHIEPCPNCLGECSIRRFVLFGTAIPCPTCDGSGRVLSIRQARCLISVEHELHPGSGIWQTQSF